ncbi:CotH kinase family protein [Paenibacillus sp. J2TS4]|uniref:CotH kinase family protein n=1 Tax=Paenibacillus sp. J2TS4 TaxID=2807194 RepID=UPI001B28A6B3|nr:CotH kinase family protein [Paenibacillus sp. J2TS4]GIP33756.1 hypothetical protein J2TS4_29660 [Paenibacillus sp. J2TS4]
MKQSNARRRIWNRMVVCLGIVALLGGCTSDITMPETKNQEADKQDGEVVSVENLADLAVDYRPRLVENRSVYEEDRGDTIVDLYLTIADSNTQRDPSLTWAELNKITLKEPAEPAIVLDAIFQEGDEKQPKSGMFGYEDTLPNASVTIRGSSTRKSPQKAYKIKLSEGSGLWREQKTINLLKHPYDITRIRNKLSFDYFKEIPDMASLRTQFVRLHVKDLTTNAGGAGFVDYGLYTQIEQPNKSFLRKHGLDPNAHLYKANYFEFFRYPEELKLIDDPTYDELAFERILKIKGNKDHSKLLRMLDDVNDEKQSINEVFDRHFDRDNFLTWMAVNILFDNMDTNSQNFYLYSPLNSEKWFFLPWDYDGAWGYTKQRGEDVANGPWENGISNYWGSKLQNRFFKNPDNVQQLIDKMEELKAYITPEKTKALLDQYRQVAPAVTLSEPDIGFLPGTPMQYAKEWDRLIGLPEENARLFLEALENPMPVFLADVEWKDGQWLFEWTNSYDLQSDDLTYHFQISQTPDFTDMIEDRDGLTVLSQQVQSLPPGKYYWRVLISDSKGNQQVAFDVLEHRIYYGIREFHITGTAENPQVLHPKDIDND